MGIPDSSLLDLIEKVRSWIYWGGIDLQGLSGGFEMPDNCSKMCCECHATFTNTFHRFHCQSCGQWFCGKCIPGHGLDGLKSNAEGVESIIKFCKLCSEIRSRRECGRKDSEKVHPSVTPRESPEPPSPSFGGERIKCSADGESIQSDHFARYLEARDYGYYPHAMTSGSMSSFSAHPSPVHVRRSSSR